jgi:hypothetical protein
VLVSVVEFLFSKGNVGSSDNKAKRENEKNKKKEKGYYQI